MFVFGKRNSVCIIIINNFVFLYLPFWSIFSKRQTFLSPNLFQHLQRLLQHASYESTSCYHNNSRYLEPWEKTGCIFCYNRELLHADGSQDRQLSGFWVLPYICSMYVRDFVYHIQKTDWDFRFYHVVGLLRWVGGEVGRRGKLRPLSTQEIRRLENQDEEWDNTKNE